MPSGASAAAADGPPPTLPDPAHTLLVFDLDNCLYPRSCGIGAHMTENLYSFCRTIGFTDDESRRRCFQWFNAYGMSLHGLVDEFDVDVDAFDRHVDGGVPLELLPPELPGILDSFLSSLKGYRKHVFTNGQMRHAERILGALKVRHHFDGITACDYRDKFFVAKPEAGAYVKAMKDAGVWERWLAEYGPEARHEGGPRLQIYFIDDNWENCDVARTHFGWHAAHLDEPGHPRAHHAAGPDAEHLLTSMPAEMVAKSRAKRERNHLAWPRCRPGLEGRGWTVDSVWGLREAWGELFGGVPGAIGAPGEEEVVEEEGEMADDELMQRAEEEGVEVFGGGLS
ncbi:hypothetical protein DFJ74DRAFT_771860 [Hyaloraphidium curvatum]|nr:hypothetical protein DFJ74DRAFT_771860 [Hyaloraphidium curvatum]